MTRLTEQLKKEHLPKPIRDGIEWLFSKNNEYELKLVFLCPINPCTCNGLVHSCIATIQNHLLYDHEIQEVVDVAITNNIIKNKSEYGCHRCLITKLIECSSFTEEEFENLNLQSF